MQEGCPEVAGVSRGCKRGVLACSRQQAGVELLPGGNQAGRFAARSWPSPSDPWLGAGDRWGERSGDRWGER